VGGAGFIGAHFTDVLLAKDGVESVTIYENLMRWGGAWGWRGGGGGDPGGLGHFAKPLDD